MGPPQVQEAMFALGEYLEDTEQEDTDPVMVERVNGVIRNCGNLEFTRNHPAYDSAVECCVKHHTLIPRARAYVRETNGIE